jgi:hypothetical protein
MDARRRGPTAGVWAAASSLELTGAILPVSIQWSSRLARGQAATA